jgi:hypothetical protein
MLCEVGFAVDNGQPIVGLAAFSFDSVNCEACAGQHDNEPPPHGSVCMCARAKHPADQSGRTHPPPLSRVDPASRS